MTVSGSDTREYDQFRQGIYARGSFNRRSALPVLGPEIDSYSVKPSVFGQPKTFTDESAFQDLADIDPVDYINDENNRQTFPAILGNSNVRDPYQMDGVLEPLTIRSKATFTSIDFPFEAHDVKGQVMGGATDSTGRTTQISQQSPISQSFRVVPFVDSGEEIGPHPSSSIRIPGNISSINVTVTPFSDQDVISSLKYSVTLTGDEIIRNIMSMDPDDEDIISKDHRSSGAGFTYVNCSPGTDSLAFGGLKK